LSPLDNATDDAVTQKFKTFYSSCINKGVL
jgi:hypothetical protein